MVNMKMKNSKLIISLLIIILVIFLIIGNKNSYENKNCNIMIKKAEKFYKNGKLDKAIIQLNIYLQNKSDDIDTWMKLAEYYKENRDESSAFRCYVKAEENYLDNDTSNEYNKLVLCASKKNIKVKKSLENIKISIKPIVKETKNAKILIQSENLYNGNSNEGCIDYLKDELKSGEYLTTDWFTIDDTENEYLTMTGGFNCSIWQFKDKKGTIISTYNQKGVFRDKDSCSIDNMHKSTVKIPKGAQSARVTYIDYSLKDSSSTLDDKLYIVYGSIPKMIKNTSDIEIDIPDLDENSFITYENSKWYLNQEDTKTELENYEQISINKGSTIYLSGDLCGKVVITGTNKEKSLKGEYGVRWKVGDTENICERVGDANELNFNYLVDNNWAGYFENDFDDIYPWSEIKLCSIDKQGNIIYSDKDEFRTDGSSGDVMVEIPKYYFKREIIDGYEYIWISQDEKEGYSLDPSFVTTNGIVDKIYVGAYLTGIEEDKEDFNIISEENPIINLSLDDINNVLKKRGERWKEIDINALMTIQRLFLVETAIKDSQMLFKGPTNLVWGTTNSEVTSVYAFSSSKEKTNIIQLKNNNSSKRFKVGDAITIIQVPNEYSDKINGKTILEEYKSYYSILSNYENTNEWNREILSIRESDNGNISIEFSGEPIEVTSHQTMIMHLPRKNGQSNNIEYHTGVNNDNGLNSFKYRYMENIWGNVSVLLDGVTINSGNINIKYNNNDEVTLSYKLPLQDKNAANNALGSECMILNMGLDLNNNSIMLPDSVGSEGTSPVTSFGDALFYSDYYNEMCLAYGFTWDLRQYAGLFSYRTISKTSKAIEYGSRLVYK